MIDQAIEKITKEMMELDSQTAIVIEEHLTKLCTSEEVAQKILNKDKTIKGAINAMKEEARKIQEDGCGVLTDEEGFEIVDKYFEIDAQGTNTEKVDVLDLI